MKPTLSNAKFKTNLILFLRIVAVCVFIIFIYMLNPFYLLSTIISISPYKFSNSSHDNIIIVFWSRLPGGRPKLWIPHPEQSCPESRCWVTHDRNYVNKAHAVIFLGYKKKAEPLPAVRSPGQRYIFFSHEAPDSKITETPANFFNWTMTYRADSDIFTPYGFLQPRKNIFKDDDIWPGIEQVVANKTKSVAWFVTHCNTSGKREEYIANLRKYINVDVYGGCVKGALSCPIWRHKCEDILDNYFFYLAFENIVCKDYVTEKVWMRIKKIVVPVVLQRKNLSPFMPQHSFIAADDFSTPKKLAKQLHYLMQNKTAYKEYLEWKLFQESIDQTDINDWQNYGYCKACELLHKNMPPKMYKDMESWWVKDGSCKGKYP